MTELQALVMTACATPSKVEHLEKLLQYWGKAQPVFEGGPVYHPLPYHCLDVAAVTQAYFEARPALLARLSALLGMTEAYFLKWAAFYAASHDVGKFDPPFQAKQPDLYKILWPTKALCASDASPHSATGLVAFFRYVQETWYGEAERGELMQLEPVLNATCGHHGQPEHLARARDLPPLSKGDGNLFLGQLKELFELDSFIDLSRVSEEALREASSELAGSITLCDWVGSNQTRFGYQVPRLSLKNYYFGTAQHRGALEKARAVVADLHLGQKKPAARSGFDYLYPHYAGSASPLQAYADTVELPSEPGPLLFILEDETGSGKTEAAMTLASRLVSAGRAEGVLVSLPTQTTANSLFKRVATLPELFFAPDEHPSLVLAHGQSKYALSRLAEEGAFAGTVSADLHAWTSDSRKTALLADFGVCTIDQVVLSALPVRHYVLRQLGIGRKVLVVDEAHACEPYLLELLAVVMELHAQRGGSAIILSATLPRVAKQKLVDAFRRGSRLAGVALTAQAYPLATMVGPTGSAETAIAGNSVERKALFTPLREADVERLIVGWLEAGRCVCLLRNTVRTAQAAFDYYSALFPGLVTLVHAKYVGKHRANNDNALLDQFGKEGAASARGGHLVIATQVAEQSLDIDFDEMVTDLAPLDALLQRLGRCRRHPRSLDGTFLGGKSSDGRGERTLHVVMPRAQGNENFLQELSPYTSFVYSNPMVLYRTALLIESQGAIVMPSGVRAAIEYAYDTDAIVPDYLVEKTDSAAAKERNARKQARYVALDVSLGYSQPLQVVPREECVTRLGEPSIRIILCDKSGHALFGAVEESSVNIRSSLLNLAPDAQGDFNLKMTPIGPGQWAGEARDWNEKLRTILYDVKRGFSVSAPIKQK